MVGNKSINLLIITSEAYPKGGAATNRIRSYAKGLANFGNKINVISLKPNNLSNYLGYIDGYSYLNLSVAKILKRNNYLCRWNLFI